MNTRDNRVLASVSVRSGSQNRLSLLALVVPLMMVVGFVLLLMQGISEIIKQVGVMRGVYVDPRTAPSSH